MSTAKCELSGIRNELPHGAIIEIAKRAGVLAPTVSRALMGDNRSPKLPEITKATAEFLKEYREKQNEATKALTEALSI
jgi:DNA-binding LacI/PurR family transcriptional regulator